MFSNHGTKMSIIRLYSTKKVVSKPVSSLTKIGFNQPIDISSKETFNESLKTNKTFAQLHALYLTNKLQFQNDNDITKVASFTPEINSQRTLPRTQFPKNKIFQQVIFDPKIPKWRKSITKWYRLGTTLLRYYRDGIKNTIKAYRSTTKYDLRTLFRQLEIDNTTISTLKINRKDFIESLRSRNEFKKIPNFILLSLIFEECTVLICYFWPRVALWNCLNPGGFKKLSDSLVQNEDPFQNEVIGDARYISPYSLDFQKLHSNLRRSHIMRMNFFKLKFYELFQMKNPIIERLVNIYQYIFIDDRLLLQSILHGNEKAPVIWGYDELVNFILERKLYHHGEDLNKLVNTNEGRDLLIWRMLLYLSFRFDNTIYLNGTSTFSEKWGTYNMYLLNNPGTSINHDATTKITVLKENIVKSAL
ncbi:Pnt1p NDAI_0E00970 [Naumovozyma dairenensis CBS 421]|uniref:Uncharacterized protein n=1 Tax=Naumovozyma dairenensis (strain ATCC 10597 / BCRC 20456 / CBS 421 / NBRC 0211 / NRRL Y-12639) TaxID=1071378 RepID=G0WAZ3_NAUDC|nr:hypothetical protein NDAI_0E00970 [Naumovozyma dairenensis CBS 421]CCD24913.1 hypothetical protein NDAI_0E00970 [Naumovozyma dairenensis CBS 421]